MEKTGLVILLSLALLTLSSCAIREYYHVQLLKTWTEAQSYCRENFADLATIETEEDWEKVRKLFDNSTRHIWIGLYDDINGWRWSMDNTYLYNGGDTTLGDWFALAVNSHQSAEHCIEIFQGTLYDQRCEKSRRPVCYDETSKTYIAVTTPMTWSSAQSHCRKKYTDLTGMRNQQEKEAIMSVIDDQPHWIGLSRDSWKWSDQSSSLFRAWWTDEPNNQGGREFCASNFKQGWADIPCDYKSPFICSVSPTMKLLKVVLKPERSVDLNDPQVQEAVLKQMEKHMRDQGIQKFRLSWRKQPNGEIFNKREAQL
ncbi:macrophage mannose receptor 1-like [Thunnus thynnus]|uniref:macrophage mannose receptor 1-like n=1 Tax=Thunnus thynnus TaxID=8237 RepID=UPI003528306D